MNHDQHTADEQARQMLEHFRQHSGGEPSAQLDAQILAAASAAVRSKAAVAAKSGLSGRLHHWLFGASGRPRWSLALAGVACLGIGVSLTWRTLEQTPDAFDAVPSGLPTAPAAARMAPQSLPAATPLTDSATAEPVQRSRTAQPAPALQGYSADAATAEKKRSAAASSPMLGEAPTAEALHEQLPPAADRVPAQRALSKTVAPSANQAERQLRSELQRLLKLRSDGWTDEADALLLKLMREYPELDVDVQLQQLQQAD
ncbi:hypothetical protein [uncultured Pseudomonas sp.]|uniref:hypothetical protein n=1 Tax=uncultured Pseudomonas sp. TaxID=114707 RepID=UPI00260D1607|nr:hypothetical protein [uncultured Pseudomonas sp.]